MYSFLFHCIVHFWAHVVSAIVSYWFIDGSKTPLKIGLIDIINSLFFIVCSFYNIVKWKKGTPKRQGDDDINDERNSTGEQNNQI
jgi:hypothetical protein